MDELLQALSFPLALVAVMGLAAEPSVGSWPGWSKGLGQDHGRARPPGPENLCMQLASLLKCRWR